MELAYIFACLCRPGRFLTVGCGTPYPEETKSAPNKIWRLIAGAPLP
jgi:hypothetical protein